MLKLEDLKPGLSLIGLEPSVIATLAAVVPIGDDSMQVFYRTPDGQTKERLLGRSDEENISIATAESPWSFDGNGDRHGFIATIPEPATLSLLTLSTLMLLRRRRGGRVTDNSSVRVSRYRVDSNIDVGRCWRD